MGAPPAKRVCKGRQPKVPQPAGDPPSAQATPKPTAADKKKQVDERFLKDVEETNKKSAGAKFQIFPPLHVIEEVRPLVDTPWWTVLENLAAKCEASVAACAPLLQAQSRWRGDHKEDIHVALVYTTLSRLLPGLFTKTKGTSDSIGIAKHGNDTGGARERPAARFRGAVHSPRWSPFGSAGNRPCGT